MCMRRLFFCTLIFSALAASAISGDVVIQGNMYPLNITPTFNHGYLAVYEEGGIAVYTPEGSLAMRISPPDGGNNVNADIDHGGTVALATHRGHVGIISIFATDGSPDGQIDTGKYLPSQVCFGPDHSLWTLGSEDNIPARDRSDYFLLRHYSRTGDLLGEFFPRSAFPEDSDPGQAMVGLWRLRIAGDRIGALLHKAGPGDSHLWLETDLTGTETGRWAVPPDREPVAMTDRDAVYASTGSEFSALDRATGSWKAVAKSSRDILLGAEGNVLVFAVRGTSRIRRATQP